MGCTLLCQTVHAVQVRLSLLKPSTTVFEPALGSTQALPPLNCLLQWEKLVRFI